MTFETQFPRLWLRVLAIGVGLSGVLWIATGVAWKQPNWLLTLLVGALSLPIGVALARNLDGMAQFWGRRALGPFSIRTRNRDLDEDIRERVAVVREEGAGRQAGGGLIIISVGWIAGGIGLLMGVLHT